MSSSAAKRGPKPAADPGLGARVLARLDRVETKKGDEGWKLLVLAALEDDDALAAALEADQGARGPGKAARSAATAAVTTAAAAAQRAAPEPRLAYLRSIPVEGFRGIGPEVDLDLPPGPG